MSYDVTDYIRASISETVSTLALTVLLVAFVCWLFLQSWRAMLVPVVTIPVSVLLMFTVVATTLTGMLASTLVGVLLVPSLYAIFQRLCDRDAPSHGESTLW